MTGYCKDCGETLEICECKLAGGRPVNSGEALAPSSPAHLVATDYEIGRLPKAGTVRRLLGSGIEYIAYSIFVWFITILDSLTAGILGLLSLLLVVLILLRDFKGGLFSLGKRVSQLRVVDRRTGHATSNAKAILRNSYYLALPLLAAFLPWIDWLSSFIFTMFIVLDVMMILASPRGLRLGDFLAGTQVVEARV